MGLRRALDWRNREVFTASQLLGLIVDDVHPARQRLLLNQLWTDTLAYRGCLDRRYYLDGRRLCHGFPACRAPRPGPLTKLYGALGDLVHLPDRCHELSWVLAERPQELRNLACRRGVRDHTSHAICRHLRRERLTSNRELLLSLHQFPKRRTWTRGFCDRPVGLRRHVLPRPHHRLVPELDRQRTSRLIVPDPLDRLTSRRSRHLLRGLSTWNLRSRYGNRRPCPGRLGRLDPLNRCPRLRTSGSYGTHRRQSLRDRRRTRLNYWCRRNLFLGLNTLYDFII